VQSLMKKYDVNESGDLDRSQLKQLMTDYNNKVEPNEEEVSFVLKMADARSTGSVSDENEIKEAVSAWKGLQRDMDLINARYEHYDNNQSGMLEKGQLKVLLQDLNEGIPPTKAEVEWVLAAADKSESGGVDHDELRAAIAIDLVHADGGGGGHDRAADRRGASAGQAVGALRNPLRLQVTFE